MGVRNRVYQILECTEEDDRVAKGVMILISLLIVFSVVSVILESIPSIFERYHQFFFIMETITVAIFTVEYGLRIWVCVENPSYSRPIVGRLRYAVSFYALIDLVAILPFYLPVVYTFDARFLRVLRLLRIFRIAKMVRYSDSMSLLVKVMRKQKEIVLVTLVIIVMLIVVASSVMWHVECEAQPDKFSSIPETMWWAVATITTVGYGDIYPVTALGKVLAAVIALLGIMAFAMPAGIIASGFMEEVHKKPLNCEGTPTDDIERTVSLLERLDSLRRLGSLTEEEFAQQKAILLAGVNGDASDIEHTLGSTMMETESDVDGMDTDG